MLDGPLEYLGFAENVKVLCYISDHPVTKALPFDQIASIGLAYDLDERLRIIFAGLDFMQSGSAKAVKSRARE